MRPFLAAAALTTALAAPATAQPLPGNPAQGLAYAEAVCAECHRVAESTFPERVTFAPDFVDIANTPGMSPMALYAWLQSEHPTMPQLILGPDETADVIAYIWSLRGEDWSLW